ncbi:MAG: Gfo/Idh/MocA family oxidoreductase [Candidatus Nanopelagicales bacterium]
MSRTLGVLLLGYGLAGRVFHAPLIGACEGLEIRAVVTGNADRQAQVRTDLPSARIHESSTSALNDISDIDLVVVANANQAHVPDAMRAIAAGQHVVVDKPLAGSCAEALHVASAARTAGVQLHTFQNRRWDSDFLALRSVAASGQLGTLHRLESRFERLKVEPKGNWRESAAPEQLGGVLLDFGAHLVDQALTLLGPVQAVDAYARSIRRADDADDDMQILLTHTSGAVSLLVGSQVSAFSTPRFLLLGSRGGVRIAEADIQEDQLRAGQRPCHADWGLQTTPAQLAIGLPDGGVRQSSFAMPAGAWQEFYLGVRESITQGSPPPVPIDDVIANLRVLDAARASVTEQARVQISPPVGHG